MMATSVEIIVLPELPGSRAARSVRIGSATRREEPPGLGESLLLARAPPHDTRNRRHDARPSQCGGPPGGRSSRRGGDGKRLGRSLAIQGERQEARTELLLDRVAQYAS